jgi:ABC-2 type transport system ATP-binding protein
MIQTENLTKKFKDALAVDGLNLSVSEGEVFGFLGPNGAGKTTTVRMLAGLIAPTAGRAVVNGFEVGRANTDVRRSVGILTETPGLYDNLSARYNLEIYARLYEVKDVKGQVEKYLRFFGLWDRADEEAGSYSKGMKQKLAIARALLHEPPLLFLDEPTSGLDPEAALLVRDSISELRREGRTIFMTTHNLDEADRLCDRIGVFKTHMLVEDTPDQLRTRLFGRKVVIHLRAAGPELALAASSLPFARQVQTLDDKLLVTVDDPDRNNPDLIRALVSAGADIRFVGELRHSLEDVYLQFVHGAEA